MTQHPASSHPGQPMTATDLQFAARRPTRSASWQRCAVLAALALVQLPAAANRVFFDDFNAEAGGNTAVFQQSLTNFNVAGWIDVIAPDNQLGYTVDSTVIDIGGGLSGGSIQTQDWYRWEAGDTVTVSFMIAGNQIRPENPDVPFMQFDFLPDMGPDGNDYVDVERFWAEGWYTTDFGPVRLGDYYFMVGTLLPGDFPWTRQTLSFTPVLGGSVKFLFGTNSGGGYGPLIDDFAIDITPVPEPGTWALMGLGLAAICARLRRRRPD
jgi:PEP-CTERM motif